MKDSPFLYVVSVIVHALIVGASIIYAAGLIGASDRTILHEKIQGLQERSYPIADKLPVHQKPSVGGESLAEKSLLGNKIALRMPQDHIYGDPTAPLKLILYMDVECPFCKRLYPVAKQLVDDSNRKINLAIRHYPLDTHKNARTYAIASECVAVVGGDAAFYEYFDSVFNDALVKTDFNPPLKHLNAESYSRCIEMNTAAQDVDADYMEGVGLGVSGTPVLVVFNAESGLAIMRLGYMTADKIKLLFEEVR
jgi:protein-disulfide isomerase